MTIRLQHLAHLPRPGDASGRTDLWDLFLAAPEVASLDWPDDVLEQFLFDHGNKPGFVAAYGHLDLRDMRWRIRTFKAEELRQIGHGTYFEHVEETRQNPRHWIGNWRGSGVDLGWETIGSWRRPPVLIDGYCAQPAHNGLHVVEGHTRLGLLQGLIDDGTIGAHTEHRAWFGSCHDADMRG
jgi:hypothetical protein